MDNGNVEQGPPLHDVDSIWRKKFGGMELPEVKWLKSLEEENAWLFEAMLDKGALLVSLGRKL